MHSNTEGAITIGHTDADINLTKESGKLRGKLPGMWMISFQDATAGLKSYL